MILISEGGWRVEGTRISLDSVIHCFLEGTSPEEIALQFSALSLEQVHGAIAFYLGRREERDKYLTEQQAMWKDVSQDAAQRADSLLNRLRQANSTANTPRKTA